MNSKQKGKRGELEWAAYCRQQGYDCRRTAQYCGNTGDASDVVGLPGIHQEVKRVEHLNIYEAIEQAERDKKDFEIPIVAHRKNRFPWIVTMKAEDWFKIYREFEAGRDEHKPSKGIDVMMDTFSIKECPEYDPEEKRKMPYKCHAE